MCGIGGYISKEINHDEIIHDMMNIIEHRGPDDHGYAIFEEDDKNDSKAGSAFVGLGHRRLSILDLSELGHQPMSYKDDRFWMVYNGEVYNYVELRDELVALGHSFVSQSDSEVILAAYAQWGAECQHKLNGMWAFAIFDRDKKTLFLSRDRFGIKPLYHWVSPKGDFYFGSEIKQFTVLPDWKAVLNHQRAYDFLNWGLTDHTDETLFLGVHHLLPGHCMTLSLLDDGSYTRMTSQWYFLTGKKFVGTFDDAKCDFRELMKDSVRLQMRADVDIGSCLSGGLDSSTIVCLMNGILREQNSEGLQKTFSACSTVSEYDERKWIDLVVNKTGVDPHYCYPSIENLFEEADKLTWHQDEPFGSTSIFAQWNVFKLAADKNVRVMLDGQGADEQLAGYHPYYGARLASLFKSGRWVQFIKETFLIQRRHGKPWKWLASYTVASLFPDFAKIFIRKLMAIKNTVPDWLNMSILNAEAKELHLGAAGTVNELSYTQLTTGNLRMLLHWEDRDSMAHSVESRVPFLDHRLVEFVLGLPEDYKICDAVTKRVLREGMRGVLPDEITDRKDKIGFATAEEVWLRENADLFRQKMRESIKNSCGILNDAAMAHLDDVIEGRKSFSFLIWRMINFGQWMKIFDVSLTKEMRA
jgi:asparagine synthase (glutamine-hydrolysing)